MSDANRTHDLGSQRRHTGTVWLLGLTFAIVVLLVFGGESLRLALRYERAAILEGKEYWRLATAHLVHGTTLHATLNLAGLALIAALFPRHYSVSAWLAIAAISIAAIDIGFLWNEPQLDWYVGLSGVLHGSLAAGAVAWWRRESRLLALALTVIFVGKLTWEQWNGSLPLAGDLPVIIDAHLYGAIGGAFAALILTAVGHRWPRIVRPL